ncbi:sigma-70 family RNA polymerase sigma factor [Winogradskyella luteola]|uniref:RNA polymerase sigma factor RpoD/SigA n=1 Tax=Winogradskyella luteola TaxID=2828330 RepID=A0A9X1JLQ2_9FLAO|nr:RNA polymerase sigma factor RpoD/SigA [Winogradskyella luteola]MBV7267580.1 RNA polymerase sigma factor RpoD/SigA [Winogradskyella luteola]
MKSLIIIERITIRNEESLNKYLNDISKISLISLEKEVELATQIKAGNKFALDELIKANLRFVVSVAKQYQNKGLPLPDLINEGNLGLLKAAKRFDETLGFKFISYAVWWIRQGIVQSLSENSRMVRLPLNKIGVINKIKKVKNIFEQKHGREPTSCEISEIIEVSIEEVDICIKSSAYGVSIDAPLSPETNLNMQNIIITDAYPQPDNVLLLESLNVDLVAVLNSLSERDSDIIKLHYGIGFESSMTLVEIAQLFGITRERVRQIKESAILNIKNSNKSQLLLKYLG